MLTNALSHLVVNCKPDKANKVDKAVYKVLKDFKDSPVTIEKVNDTGSYKFGLVKVFISVGTDKRLTARVGGGFTSFEYFLKAQVDRVE